MNNFLVGESITLSGVRVYNQRGVLIPFDGAYAITRVIVTKTISDKPGAGQMSDAI